LYINIVVVCLFNLKGGVIMNFQQIIQELKNYHTDMIMWRNRIKQWVTGTGVDVVSGQVPFPWSDGTTTNVDTIPTIIGKVNGAVTKTAYENLSAGDLVKLFNEGGIYKAKKLVLPTTTTSVVSGASTDAIIRPILTSDGKVIALYVDGVNVYAKIGTVQTNNTIIFGTAYNIFGALNGVPIIDVIQLTGDANPNSFLVTIFDGADAYGIVCRYVGDAISFGVHTSFTSTNYVNSTNRYDIKYNALTNEIYVIYFDGTISSYTLKLRKVNVSVGGLTVTYDAPVTVASDPVPNYIISPKLCFKGNALYIMWSYIDSTDNKLYMRSYSPLSGSPSLSGLSTIYSMGANIALTIKCFEYDITNNVYHTVLFDINALSSVIYRKFLTDNFTNPVEEIEFSVAIGTLGIDFVLDFENKRLYIHANTPAGNSRFVEYHLAPSLDMMDSFPLSGLFLTLSFVGYGRRLFTYFSGVTTTIALYNCDERDSFFGICTADALITEDVTIATSGGVYPTTGLIAGKKYFISNFALPSLSVNNYPIGIALSDTELKLY
jgi:hypothetical protein